MRYKQETVIFLHIPKAAGTTLTNVLKRQYRKEERWQLRGVNSLEKLNQLSNSEKHNIKLIYGHFPFGVHKILPQPSTYVTLLRDPVQRVVSHYFYARQSPNHRLHKIINQEKISLKDYITSRINAELNNGQVRLISGNTDAAYGMCTKGMLEEAKSNLKSNFSIVGTVENFDKFLLAVGKTSAIITFSM